MRLRPVFVATITVTVSLFVAVTVLLFSKSYRRSLTQSTITYGHSILENISLNSYDSLARFDFYALRNTLNKTFDPDKFLFLVIRDNNGTVVFARPDNAGSVFPVSPDGAVAFESRKGVVLERRITARGQEDAPVGTVDLGLNLETVDADVRTTIGHVIIAAVFLWILGIGATIYLGSKLFIRPIVFLQQQLERLTGEQVFSENAQPVKLSAHITEFRSLESNINGMFQELRRYQREATESLRMITIAQTASQVAHDIRSPVAALDSVMGRIVHVSEDDRVVIRGAVNRIKDIANNLIEKNRTLRASISGKQESVTSGTIEPARVQLLSSLVDPLVTEKRTQFRSKIGIEIDGKFDASSYGLFARVQSTEFKCVLSNLINNSVEALGERGLVAISLAATPAGQIEIKVRDNGKGIRPEVISRLGQRGETYDKVGGSGLGLFHARTNIESWGGTVQIKSELGKGTTVVLTLPQTRPPNWFVSELILVPSTTVVVLDDDSSIHGIWQGRFDTVRVQEKEIKVVHFSTPDGFSTWVTENRDAARSALFLADYELLGHKKNGLDLIEAHDLGPQSILVTSRFEEKQVLEGCQRLGVRLIPKGMAGFVPIRFATLADQKGASSADNAIGQALLRPDAILIDDDQLVHLAWQSSAKSQRMTLVCFTNPDDFFTAAPGLDKRVPVYVDSGLGVDDAGKELKGEEIASRIKDLGFAQIILSTGLVPEGVENMSWLSGVRGKEPPFEEPGFRRNTKT